MKLTISTGDSRKKLFISQPMKDLTQHEIRDIQRRIVDRYARKIGVLSEDVHVINYFPEYVDELKKSVAPEKIPCKFIIKSLDTMIDADAVVFANGWESARGCRIERKFAEEYGIQYFDEDSLA